MCKHLASYPILRVPIVGARLSWSLSTQGNFNRYDTQPPECSDL